MRKFAVAHVNYYNNDVQVKVVEADDWEGALEAAFPGYLENVSGCEMEEAKDIAVSQEWGFDIVEVD